MCCDVLVFWDAMIFCDNFARWLQKIVATCDVTRWFSWMLWSFVLTLQDDQKIVACEAMCWVCWYVMIFCNNFCKMITKDSSIMWRKLVFWDVMIFCNNVARWLQKIVACESPSQRTPRRRSSVANKKLRDFAPTTLGVCISEYSNQAKFNRFLLNRFQLDRFPRNDLKEMC